MASDEIDSLFEVLPAEFVKARNVLAKSLKASGHREAAERAAKLTRPTASVWATNQVARRDSKLVQRLAEATEKLQGGVVRDKARYAEAINTHRELLNSVRQRIEAVLHEGGLRDAPATVGAAVQNFRSGLMDERARPVIEGGRLQEDVGLDAGDSVFGFSAPAFEEEPSPPAHHAPPKPATAARRPEEDDGHARERERERREQERARAKAYAEAERRVHALRKAADAAAAARAKREAAAAAARRELESAERALSDAQAAEREAAAALAEAEADLAQRA